MATRYKSIRYDRAVELEKKLYKKRKNTVEPVFGIIKQVLGFRQPRTPHPSGHSPAMALSLRRPEHPSSPVLCQNLKRDRLLKTKSIKRPKKCILFKPLNAKVREPYRGLPVFRGGK